MKITDLFDGKAQTIKSALVDSKEINLRNVMGFGSDGAAVMIGRETGVSTRLKVHNPLMVNIHCVAHRLALAASQASNDIPYLKKFKNIVHNLYQFYHNSPVRMAGLHAIQEVLGDQTLKLKEAKDVRWLSHNAAIQTLRRTLPSVVASLEREAVERGEPVALGLAKMIKTYEFVATLYLFSDILPHICRLSLVFQREDVDLALIRPQVNATLTCIAAYTDNLTPSLSKLDEDLDTSLHVLGITVTPTKKVNFQTHIQKKYVKALEEQLQNRFPNMELLDSFCIFNPSQLDANALSRLQILIDHYGQGDTPLVEEDALRVEWELFRVLLGSTYKDMSHNQVLKLVAGNATVRALYPNLSKLAKVCLILPVSTADCERSFSTMKRVKTDLRNRMNTSTLDALMRIRIEGPSLSEFDFDTALNSWAKLRNRRIKV